MKKRLKAAAILYGAAAMAGQVVFLREFLVIFYGNEISLGLILAGWLVSGGTGSMLLGRFADKIKSPLKVLSLSQAFLAVSFLGSFMLLRSAKVFMGLSPGEIAGFTSMISVILAVLILPCVLLGFMFALLCRLYRDASPGGSDDPVSGIYVMEAVGALLGGGGTSFFLLRFISHTEIIGFLLFANLAAAFFFFSQSNKTEGKAHKKTKEKAKKPLVPFIPIILLTIVFVLFFGQTRKAEEFFTRKLWPGVDVIASRDSVYGNITVTERHGEVSFYENGLHLYTIPDPYPAEKSVHFALLQSLSPENILLIGGGPGGRIEEVLKHPVQNVDYLEIDPAIIEMSKKYMPEENLYFLRDPRVNIINRDGREFVKNAERKYDAVLLGMGDPYTAKMNRFYTVNFFKEVRNALSDRGIVAFSLTSSPNYVGEELGKYLSSVKKGLREVFSDVLVIPGDSAYFLAASEQGTLETDTFVLAERMKDRGLETLYVTPPYLEYRMSGERLDFMAEALDIGSVKVLNTDMRPVSYYYATAFWSTHFDTSVSRNFIEMFNPRAVWAAGIMLSTSFVGVAFMLKDKGQGKFTLPAVAVTGFSEITFQMAIIIAFQSIYGFVFSKIGIIVTSFMVGLALGGWIMGKKLARVTDRDSMFLKVQGAIALYPLILPPIFILLATMRGPAPAWWGSNIVFAVLPSVAGFMGGMQFPLAGRIHLADRDALGRTAGMCYGSDLLGACVGALLTGGFLIPVLGITGTCFFTAMLNFSIFAALLLGKRRNMK